jgi:hypothetical protein
MRDEAAALGDDAWTAAMRRGDFAAAWQVSDAVLRERVASCTTCWHWPRHRQFVWTGGALEGRRVLVRCYHGLGDTLQFIRFAEPLSRLARRVVVWAQPALMPLLRSAAGVDEVVALHDGAPEAEYDADIEIMELPHALRIDAATLPRRVPYLAVDPGLVAARRRVLRRDGRLAVGVVWAAGSWDERRSVPVTLLARLGDIPGVAFHCLQQGPALARWRAAGPSLLFEDGCEHSEDVLEAATTMRALDLVISVDTMAAHLAGALGVPVWTLLHAASDWRWMAGREDSPWYPTMRLFRQERAGDWVGVLARVATALAPLARR